MKKRDNVNAQNKGVKKTEWKRKERNNGID